MRISANALRFHDTAAMAGVTSPSTDALTRPNPGWEDLQGITSEGKAELKAAGLTPATAEYLQALRYSDAGDSQAIAAILRFTGARVHDLPPIQTAKVLAFVGMYEEPEPTRPDTDASHGPDLTWDQLLDINSEGKAELQAACVTPATAQVLQALGYTQAGDLRFISDQLLSQCLGLPPYHTARLRAMVQGNVVQGDHHQLLPSDVFDRVKHLDAERDRPEVAQLCMGCGGIAGLVALLSSKDNAAAAQAAWALKSLSATSNEHLDSIAALGGGAPLLGLLSSECVDVKEQAAGALAELLSNSQERKQMTQAAGLMTTLVTLLSSASVHMQKAAVDALHALTYFRADATDKAIAAGAITPLVALLTCEDPDLRRVTGCVLYGMASPSNGDASTAAAKAIAAAASAKLLELLSSSSEGEQLKGAEVLRGPVLFGGIAEEVIAADAIPLLVGMVSSGSSELQTTAVGALGALARKKGADAASQMLAAGAMAPLMALLPSGDSPALETDSEGDDVVEVVLRLVISNTEGCRNSLVAAGAIPQLVELLLRPALVALWSLTKLIVLDALRDLAAASEVNVASIAAAGGIAALVALLSERPARLLPVATECLILLMKGSEERKAAVASAGAIAPLVVLLSDGGDEMPPGRVAEALTSLAEGSEERRAAIVAAGGAQGLH